MASQHVPVIHSIEHPPTPLDTPSPEHNAQKQEYSPAAAQNPTPSHSQNLPDTNRNAPYNKIVEEVLRNRPDLLPSDSSLLINSFQIDQIAHAMFNFMVFNPNPVVYTLFQQATQQGAWISEPRLRVLALLNIMPGWWFLRERVINWLEDTGRLMDDSWQQAILNQAVANFEKMKMQKLLRTQAVQQM